MHWTAKDLTTFEHLRQLWPELPIKFQARNAAVELTSAKALAQFLDYVGEDEDLRPRMSPVKPGERGAGNWWYTIDVTWVEGKAVPTLRVIIPPSDLAIIVGVLERKRL